MVVAVTRRTAESNRDGRAREAELVQISTDAAGAALARERLTCRALRMQPTIARCVPLESMNEASLPSCVVRYDQDPGLIGE